MFSSRADGKTFEEPERREPERRRDLEDDESEDESEVCELRYELVEERG